MKKFAIALIVLSLVTGSVSASEKIKVEAPSQVIYVGSSTILEGGEDIPSAVAITALPYSDSGDTSDNMDDYTFGTDTAPDVVYSFIPTGDITVDVSLCGSSYDTKLGIVDSALSPVAYNDDSCGLQSEVTGVALLAGETYYIIVDGYSANSGPYDFNMVVAAPPVPGETCETAIPAVEELNSCPGADYYFTFTAPIDGSVIIDTCIFGQTTDTNVYVYDVCGGTELSHNDDSYDCPDGTSYASFLEVPTAAGQEMVIYFSGNWSSDPFDWNLYVTDGVVTTETTTFGTLKSLYR